LASAVHPIQAIVASPIQENRASSALDWAAFIETWLSVPTSDLVKIVFVCLIRFVAAEFLNQLIDLIPDHFIAGHQFSI
jgi:hypothetical protein